MTPPPKKPTFTPPPTSDLLSRLNAFLPQISAANDHLRAEIAAGRGAERSIEDVSEDEERYIEMNLGLGVLEELRNPSPPPDPLSHLLNRRPPTSAPPGITLLPSDTPHSTAKAAPTSDLSSHNPTDNNVKIVPQHGAKRPAISASPSDTDSEEEEEEKVDTKMLQKLLARSTRHGNGARGHHPVLEEVVENKHTPTPEKQERRKSGVF